MTDPYGNNIEFAAGDGRHLLPLVDASPLTQPHETHGPVPQP